MDSNEADEVLIGAVNTFGGYNFMLKVVRLESGKCKVYFLAGPGKKGGGDVDHLKELLDVETRHGGGFPFYARGVRFEESKEKDVIQLKRDWVHLSFVEVVNFLTKSQFDLKIFEEPKIQA